MGGGRPHEDMDNLIVLTKFLCHRNLTPIMCRRAAFPKS
jgi:hypothetical protein